MVQEQRRELNVSNYHCELCCVIAMITDHRNSANLCTVAILPYSSVLFI